MSAALLAWWLLSAARLAAPPDAELLTLLRAAPTADERPGAEVCWLRRERLVEVDATGRTTCTLRETLLVLTDAGRRYATLELGFLGPDQDVAVRTARTVRPGGSVFDAGGEALALFELAGGARRVELSFPFVDRGAALDFEVVLTDRRPTAPEGYSDRFVFSGREPVESATFTLALARPQPPVAEVHRGHDFHGELRAEVRKRGAFTEWTWRAGPLPGLGGERDTPPLLERATWLVASTLPDWQSVAGRFRDAYRAACVSTVALRGAALREITGAADPVAALFNYVVTRCRYVEGPLETGAPGIAPRAAAATFDLPVGDCKDLSTFLLALLREAGIKAFPALLRRTGSGPLLDRVPALQQLNHVIVAVPTNGGYRWLDPTWSYGPLDYLPPAIQGARALVVGETGAGWQTVPVEPPAKNALRRSGEFTLGADGELRGAVEVRWLGALEQVRRVQFRRSGLGDVARRLAALWPEVSLEPDSAAVTPPESLGEPFVLRYRLRAPGYAAGARYKVLQAALVEPAEVPPGLADEAPRRWPLVLGDAPFESSNRLKFKLPPELAPVAIPPDEERVCAVGSFRVTYSLRGDTLEYARQVVWTATSAPPRDLPGLRAWYDALAAADRRRFVVLQVLGRR